MRMLCWNERGRGTKRVALYNECIEQQKSVWLVLCVEVEMYSLEKRFCVRPWNIPLRQFSV